MSLILNGTSGLFGNVTGGDISGNFIGLNGDASSTTALATGSTTARSLENRFADVVNVKDFGAVGNGSIDDTDEIQNAITFAENNGKSVYFPSGVYVSGAVNLSNNITIFGNGATIKRPVNFDKNDVSDLTPGIAQFEITNPGKIYTFKDIIFDGNEANQNAVDARGMFIRVMNLSTPSTTSTSINIDGCTFVNQTEYSIFADGTVNTDGKIDVNISNCSFLDGRFGIGSGDPTSGDPVGFTPSYIQCTDDVNVRVSNCRFLFRKLIAALGQYAPCGIRFTFQTNTSNINGASGIISGCYFYKIGRKNQDYLGNPDGNNGLGVIDFYARGREIIITNNQFIDCLNSGVRGKTNIDSVSIGQNIFRNTPLAINIVPNTYPTQVGNIVITDNVIENSDQYGIAVVGNSTDIPAFVQTISICSNAISNTTNITPLTTNLAAIVVRYVKTVSITGNVINGATNASLCGISAKDIQDAVISSNNIYNVGKAGIFCETLKRNAIISSNYIDTTSSWGIGINGTQTLRMVSVCDNTIDNCFDYGVIQFTTIERLTYIGNTVRNVTGLSRAFYVPDVATSVIVTGNTTNATTPLQIPSRKDVTQQYLNSWNPIVTFASGIPASGTWTVGSIIYDSTPTAAGNVGWVCVTAGTPGTWKTFGSIAA